MDLPDRTVYIDSANQSAEYLAHGTPSFREYGIDRARWLLRVETVGDLKYPSGKFKKAEVVAYRTSKNPLIPVHRQVISNVFPVVRPLGVDISGAVYWSKDLEDSHFIFVGSDEQNKKKTNVYRADISAQSLERAYQRKTITPFGIESLANLTSFEGNNWVIQRFTPRNSKPNQWYILGNNDSDKADILIRIGQGPPKILWKSTRDGFIHDFWVDHTGQSHLVRSGTQIWSINEESPKRKLVHDYSRFDWLVYRAAPQSGMKDLELRRVCGQPMRCMWQLYEATTESALIWTSLPDQRSSESVMDSVLTIHHRTSGGVPVIEALNESMSH